MKYNFNKVSIVLMSSILITAASCNKQNDLALSNTDQQSLISTTATPATTVGGKVNFTATGNKGYLLTIAQGVFGARNFHQGTVADEVDDTQWRDPASTYYYDLKNNDGGTADNYDFQFSGTANANFTVNTAKYDLSYTNTAFEQVTSSTRATLISNGVAGPNNLNGIGNPNNSGWYTYTMSNHTMSAYGPRTYVIKEKSTGKLYKLKLRNVYKDETPNSNFAPKNFPFLSFDYSALN